jgi:glycosyltransferase involved in cell wall biosynthesis
LSGVRVLHVIGGGDTGGAMSYLLPLLTALRAQGCDAHLVCLGGGGLAEAAAARALPHTVIPMSRSWDPRSLTPLRGSLVWDESGRNWDAVHTHGMRANLPVRMLLPTLRPRPLVFTTVHSDLALDYASPLKARGYLALDRLTRNAVDGFCCVSAPLARALVARGAPAARVHVVHAGIEMDDLVSLPRPDGTAPPTIGVVARMVPVKDLGLLLDAAALVAREVPHARLVMVGDGPERAALERRAAEPDLSGRVSFLGHVTPARPLLAGFDVLALSSESEGLPISVLEAMAAGVPVVATAVGGLPEALQDGVSGFLVQRTGDRAASAAALAARLTAVLSDAALRARMGKAGKRRVMEDFSSEAAARSMIAIYERTRALGRGGRA